MSGTHLEKADSIGQIDRTHPYIESYMFQVHLFQACCRCIFQPVVQRHPLFLFVWWPHHQKKTWTPRKASLFLPGKAGLEQDHRIRGSRRFVPGGKQASHQP